MRAALLVASLRLDAVVDRVEGQVAVLEWHAGEYADVPLALLPLDANEGDRVVLWVWPEAASPALASVALTPVALDLAGEPSPPILHLPSEAALVPGHLYFIDFQPAVAGPAGRSTPRPDAGVLP